MYSTCLFCHRALGTNTVLGAFPVGRRLAFDPATGRMWVVCRACGRWNLTPLEERWEAIEEAEHRYRSTRARIATAEIGMARLVEGVELVRIGRPQRPEFAAWRYGDQFGQRRRRHFIVATAGLGVGAAAAVGSLVTGGVIAAGLWAWLGGRELYRHRRAIVRLRDDDGNALLMAPWHLRQTTMVAETGGRWALEIHHRDWGGSVIAGRRHRHLPPVVRLSGPAAERAAARILPHLNAAGAPQTQVSGAVEYLEQHGSGEAAFRAALRTSAERPLADLRAPLRLALEMASHEAAERRMLEGELEELRQAWQEAEEIAAIADDLLVPDVVRASLRRGRDL